MLNNFKAIETVYAGYRFRSRLEARWAVFFDTLGIQWEYEKEGYEIEGVRYLPDFWLPEQDCFIEIKGQEPTEEERMKARLLSIYTQKCVNVFYGSVDIPEDVMRTKSLRYRPVSVWKFLKSEHTPGGPSTSRIDVPPHILSLLQHLYDHHLNLVSRHSGPYCIEPDDSRIYRPSPSELEEHLTLQLSGLQRLRPTYEALEKEIQQILSLEKGWTLEVLYQEDLWYEDEALWMECRHCRAVEITYPGGWHYCEDEKEAHQIIARALEFDIKIQVIDGDLKIRAPKGVMTPNIMQAINEHKAAIIKVMTNCADQDLDTNNGFESNTPRLLAAYTAARSARFEFGEKGR